MDNTKIAKAKSERIDKQYYIDFSVNEEETKKAIAVTEEFINEVYSFIAALNEEKIKNYGKKATELFTERKKNPKNIKSIK